MPREKQKEKRKAGWTPLQGLGAALSVLGILMLAFYAFVLVSAGHGMYRAGAFPRNGTFNATGFNTSVVGHYTVRATAGIRTGLYPILSGALMLLLGITVYKYGKLKAMM